MITMNLPIKLKIKSSTIPPMPEIMNIDRDSLIDAYAQQILDNMDIKTMERMIYDTLVDNLNSYSDEELRTEVADHYPELLES